MMYCKNCGKELVGAGIFCQSCGAKQGAPDTEQRIPAQSPSPPVQRQHIETYAAQKSDHAYQEKFGAGQSQKSTRKWLIGGGSLVAIVIVGILVIRALSGSGNVPAPAAILPPQASPAQPTPAVSAPPASIEEPEPEIPVESINWQNIVCQYTDTEGYTFEVSITISPWILQSNTSLINSAWSTVGKGNILPDINGWGLEKFTGNMYLGEFSDLLSANGKRFSATMTDMYYIVGTISVKNITDGWSFSSDNPGSVRISLDWPTFRSSNPTTMVISRIFTGGSEKTYGGTMRVLPSMTSDNWGPVPFVIAHGEMFNPNSPDGAYLNEVESGEFVLMGGYNTELQRLTVDVQDEESTGSPQNSDAAQPEIEGDAGDTTVGSFVIAMDAVNLETPVYPFFEQVGEGVVTGFEPDLYNALVAHVNPETTGVMMESFDSLLDGLEMGVYDAVLSAMAITDERRKAVDFTIPYVEYEGEQFAIAVRKGNTELLNALNSVLEEMKANGELDALIQKWFKDIP